MKVVITGAGGFLGSELAQRFLTQGHQVKGLSRTAPVGVALSAFQPVQLGEAAPTGAFAGADLVIHAAHDRRPGSEDLNVLGTQRWAEQARAEGARRQLFLSSVSAHGDAPSEYGRAKARLEQYFTGKGGLLLRPGLVAGKGGTFGDMTRMIRRFPVLPVLGGDSLQVVLTDVDSLFQTVLAHERLVEGRLYNLFQPSWVGLWTLSKAIRDHFKKKTWLLPVPLSVSVTLLSLGQKLGAPPTLGPESLKNLEHCRGYGYESSYAELGLPVRPLEVLMGEAFPEA